MHSVSKLHASPSWRLQAPAPLQTRSWVPSDTQVLCMLPTTASCKPLVVFPQVPSARPVDAARHDLQVAPQAALQQTLSGEHVALTQFAFVAQSRPFAHLVGQAAVLL